MDDFVKAIHVGPTDPLTNLQKKEAKEKLDKAYAEESQLVTGIFKNVESPGAELEFHFKKFPKDKWQTYKLQHDKKYTLPLAVAKHINSRILKEQKFVCDEMGNRTIDKNAGEIKSQFLSTEFM